MSGRPKKTKSDGLWFKRVATAHTKKNAEPIKRKLIKNNYVRVVCDGRSPKTGKIFYGVYARKKR
jgi:hypothetical protein